MIPLRFVTAADVFVFLGLLRRFCRGEERLRDPPVLFLIVLDFMFFTACFGDFLLLNTTNISGRLCFSSSFPMRLWRLVEEKRRASGRATGAMPAAKAPRPLPLCR